MAFDLYYNVAQDLQFFNKSSQELINIAGVVVKYLAVDDANANNLSDEAFRGEDASISFTGPYMVRGIMNSVPEAAKMWEAMGFFSSDSAAIIFNKDKIFSEIGRRPMPRDRVWMDYNNTGYEVSDVLEVPPSQFFQVQHLQVRLKKLIEGFEDLELLRTFRTGSEYYVDNLSATSAYVEDIMTLNHLNDIYESGTSASFDVPSGKYGLSDTDIFNGY